MWEIHICNFLCIFYILVLMLCVCVCVHPQEMLYVWTEPKLCMGGMSLPEKKTMPCEGMEFWVRLGAGLGAFTAVLLVSLTCYFWKKNKRYHLFSSCLLSSSLPLVSSCPSLFPFFSSTGSFFYSLFLLSVIPFMSFFFPSSLLPVVPLFVMLSLLISLFFLLFFPSFLPLPSSFFGFTSNSCLISSLLPYFSCYITVLSLFMWTSLFVLYFPAVFLYLLSLC